MPVEHRLQVLTNNAERLSLAVNGSTFSFTDLHQADITIPAVFLFALPSHKSDEPWATKRRWLTDTQNFLDVYLAFDGKALMIDYAEMPRDSNLVAAFINDGLLDEELLTSFEIAYQGLDWLWSLAFQAEINSYSSTEKLLAVISENTFSPEIGDSNNGAIGPPTMIEILAEYGRKDEKREATLVKNDLLRSRVNALQDDKEMLMLQIERDFIESAIHAKANYELECANSEILNLKSALVSRTSASPKYISLEPFVRELTHETLFDKEFYQSQLGSKTIPALHYRFIGWKRGLSTHPLFDVDYYLDLVGESLETLTISPLKHFQRYGASSNLSTHADFDASWYLDQYPDVADAKLPAIVHYLVYGWKEGRNPSKDFDSNSYLNRYDDVKQAESNPLIHFIQFGQAEGRIATATSSSERVNFGSV
jgi:hypothetical protein